MRIYLDDIRTPLDPDSWTIVRSYDEFVEKISEVGLENISEISLDHDLAQGHYHSNMQSGVINYDSPDFETNAYKTGWHCARWLIDQWEDKKPLCLINIHSYNPIGSANIKSLLDSYFKVKYGPNIYCTLIDIPHTWQ
jgi:hypothetical protein